MLKGWSNKNKFILLCAGAFFMFWISYRFAFSNTIDLKKECRDLENKMAKIENAPARLHHVRDELSKLEQLIGDVSADEISPLLIERAGSYCKKNHLVLKEVPQKHLFTQDEFGIVTHSLVVSGPYKKLVQLFDQLENHIGVGKVRSAIFEIEEDRKTKIKSLNCTYYLQLVVGQSLIEN